MQTEQKKSTWLDKRSVPHISTLIIVSGMATLGMNFYLPSLPGIAAHFQADYAIVQLAVSVYLISTAVFQLFLGPISDRYGRRPVLLACYSLFLAGTVFCIFSANVQLFLLGRVIQAFAAGGMVLSRAAIRDLVGPLQAASMIGYVTMGMTLVPMVGPVLGGYIEEYANWQASFAVMFALGFCTLILIWFDFGETHHNRSTNFTEQFKAYPELLTSRRFWGYTFAASFSSGMFFAFLGGAPYIAENHFHLKPSQYGMFFALLGVGYMIGNFLSGRFATRLGIAPMMTLGAVVAILGIVLTVVLQLVGFSGPFGFFGPMVLIGIGNGLTLPSAMAGMISVRPQLAGSASGLGGSMQTAGGGILSIFAGVLLGPGTGPAPLIYLMMFSAIAALVAILYVRYIDKLASVNADK